RAHWQSSKHRCLRGEREPGVHISNVSSLNEDLAAAMKASVRDVRTTALPFRFRRPVIRERVAQHLVDLGLRWGEGYGRQYIGGAPKDTTTSVNGNQFQRERFKRRGVPLLGALDRDGVVNRRHRDHEIARTAHTRVSALATATRVHVMHDQDSQAETVSPLLC